MVAGPIDEAQKCTEVTRTPATSCTSKRSTQYEEGVVDEEYLVCDDRALLVITLLNQFDVQIEVIGQ